MPPLAPHRQPTSSWTSPSPDATRRLARALAACIGPQGLCIALIGDLGAGKTLFARALAEGLGIDPAQVSSPTFTIASEYPLPGERRFVHADLYRLGSAAEFDAAGGLDWLEPGNVVAIEWADRMPQALAEDRLEIALARDPVLGEDCGSASLRRLEARALGPVAAAALEAWQRAGHTHGQLPTDD